MKSLTVSAALLVSALFVFAPATATHGGCNGNIYTVDAGAETLYIDDRAPSPNDPPFWGFFVEGEGTWIYLESNGIDGYQSGGVAQPELPGFINEDPCDHANPDTILF